MTRGFYLKPIALADSPQSEEGEAVRLGGSMVWASRFALIERRDGKVTARHRLSVAELRAQLADMPDEVRAQWDNFQRVHAPLQCGARTIRLDQPQVMGILSVTPDNLSTADNSSITPM